jgi:hypothetical protein
MSQHEVFTPYFIELGNISLTLSKLIERKKDNYSLLKNNKKIPRSLRIKCELTASPAYSTNPNFLQLKEQLQDTVADFIEKGTEIITNWTATNISLLQTDRCINILRKALQILDGLASFYAETIGEPNWPSVPSKYITLFLLKAYLTNELIDITDLLSFFELPQETILLLGGKVLTNKDSNEEILQFTDNLHLTDLDDDNETHHHFLIKTLTQFDQIIKTTTLGVWSHYKEMVKKTTAFNNLKSKMIALETINATKATSEAITRATMLHNENIVQNEYTNIRITNLEKSFRRQEHKTNELANILSPNPKHKGQQLNKNKKQQKNYSGSQPAESLDSLPTKSLEHSNHLMSQGLVDLTSDDEPYSHTNYKHMQKSLSPPQHHPKREQKRQRRQQSLLTPNEKSIQWKNAEIKQYNPQLPAAMPAPSHYSHPIATTGSHPPFFQPAPPPVPLMAPTPKPFGDSQQSLFNINPQSLQGQWNTPTMQAFNPFGPIQTQPQGQYNHATAKTTNKEKNSYRRQHRNRK